MKNKDKINKKRQETDRLQAQSNAESVIKPMKKSRKNGPPNGKDLTHRRPAVDGENLSQAQSAGHHEAVKSAQSGSVSKHTVEAHSIKATVSNDLLKTLEGFLDIILKQCKPSEVPLFVDNLIDRLRDSGHKVPVQVTTPYINTIPVEKEPAYPGDREIERQIKSIIRWNAMAMVVKANRVSPGIGGRILSSVSCATLYEVGFNHFFRGGDKDHPADLVYFQGHASPGNYARAYVEGRLPAKKLHHFRQELAQGGGLSSY